MLKHVFYYYDFYYYDVWDKRPEIVLQLKIIN